MQGFIDRMKDLAESKSHSFAETVLGHEIRVFGNVVIAVAACKMIENNAEVTRSVEMMLLIKDSDAWRIVSQAWDVESQSKSIPTHLLVTTGSN